MTAQLAFAIILGLVALGTVVALGLDPLLDRIGRNISRHVEAAFDIYTDEAIALTQPPACGDQLAADLAAAMAPQVIDAAERMCQEAS